MQRNALSISAGRNGRFGAVVCPSIEPTGVVTNPRALIASAPDMKEFLERLTREFEARQANNKRYSLRAFAAFLNTDHSTLSQILHGTRGIPNAQLRQWGRKLGMSPEEVAVYVAAQHVPSAQVIDRQEQLRHWTAEGLAIVTDPCHWQIVELTRKRGFQGDCRVIAEQVGASVDRMNVVLARLLRLRLLEIRPGGRWKNLLGPEGCTPAGFRKLALIRIRQLAAKDGVELRPARSRSKSSL